MKQLLTIMAVLFCLNAQSQGNYLDIRMKPLNKISISADTTFSYLLISDVSPNKSLLSVLSGWALTVIPGYILTQKVKEYYGPMRLDAIFTETIGYLDAQKNKLPETILVWQSKKIE